MSLVKFEKDSIRIAGQKVQIISGVVHFFRLPRASWRDRLEKTAALGCNCIESYIFWNLTEPEEGRFRLDGNLDFETFFRMAGELGLHVIVRPGPYTCSECDNGGLPWWLMNRPGMEIRRSNKPFLDAVRSYWSVILPKIAALHERILQVNPACELEVDGGIDPETSPLVKQAGANVLVAGSAVFRRCDRAAAIAAIRNA